MPATNTGASTCLIGAAVVGTDKLDGVTDAIVFLVATDFFGVVTVVSVEVETVAIELAD